MLPAKRSAIPHSTPPVSPRITTFFLSVPATTAAEQRHPCTHAYRRQGGKLVSRHRRAAALRALAKAHRLDFVRSAKTELIAIRSALAEVRRRDRRRHGLRGPDRGAHRRAA